MSENSRVEGILQATIDGDEYTDIPQSRVEELLIELKEVIEEGGGGGGTTVVANPEGEATDDLETIKIGNTIYDIPGSGGGGSSQTITDVLWSGSATPSTTGTDITLNHAISDYDFIVFTVTQGEGYEAVLPFATSELAVGGSYINTGYITDLCAFFTYTSDTAITIKSSASAHLTNYTKITGLKFCGTLAPMIYSTEEREVGVWVNNKPLYQKSYINVAGSGQSVNVTLSDLTDIETIFIVPEASGSTDVTPFPLVHYTTANIIGGFFTISNGVPTLCVRRGSDAARVGTELKYLTVRYTKTTDVPGSGSYGSLGVPMVHYDDTEKVVGTYFGKTLYEKSYTNFSSLTGQSRTLDFGLSGIDKIWYVSEGCIISDGLYPFPYIHWDPSNIVGGFWDLNDGSPRFEFRTGSNSTNAVINTFTIRYTKLTD